MYTYEEVQVLTLRLGLIHVHAYRQCPPFRQSRICIVITWSTFCSLTLIYTAYTCSHNVQFHRDTYHNESNQVYMAHVHKYVYTCISTHVHIHVHVSCTTTQPARSRWLLYTQIQTIAVPLNGNSLIKTNDSEFGLQHESSSVVTQVCSCTCQQWIHSPVLVALCVVTIHVHVCQYRCI